MNIQGVEITLPDPPERHLIQNFDLPQSQQKWTKTPLPTFTGRDIEFWDGVEVDPDEEVPWAEAVRQETIKNTGCDPMDLDRSNNPRQVAGVEVDPDYVMDCLETFRQQELNRIHNGHWIYINGLPYWLPGPYYFYLNYWWVGDACPEFRYPDLELLWLWEFVRTSDTWLGLLYITMRGTGKSYIGGALDYWTLITKKEARTGVQSKTSDDAADFFREKVMIPVMKLPEFLRGIHTEMYLGDLTDSATLNFAPPSRKKIPMRVYAKMLKEALYSYADYRPATEKAYDGQSLSFYLADEVGKCSPDICDVFERHTVIFNCVWRGGKKRGNCFLTTTVEKMEEGGEACKKIWDASDLATFNENGRTTSGLVRYFRSAVSSTYFDQFGFPDEARSKTYHDTERKSREHDQSALVAYKQKNPYSAEEAFWVTSSTCIYNQEILLTARDRVMNSGRKLVRTGDIKFKEKDKESYFIDNKFGHWQISYLDFEPNQVRISEDGKTFSPLCAHKRIMGVDPYQSRDLADPDAGSMGGASVYSRYDMHIPEDFCDTIIADYLGRPKDPFDFYEDMIAAAFFFGCPVFLETNKSNMMDYFRTRGYKWGNDANPLDFIWERPVSTLSKTTEKVTDGMYNVTGTITHYTNSTAGHINQHGHKLKHIRVIDDWIKFDPLNTKKFDAGVAASMAVTGAERKGIEVGKVIDLGEIFKTYDNRGMESRLNQR